MLGGAGGVARLFAVNVMGVVHTVEPLLPRMIARGRGQIALMSSLGVVRRPPRHRGLLRQQGRGADLGRGPARAAGAAGCRP